MTAEPIRLERVLCSSGLARPPRPPGASGERCNRRASIACLVSATSVRPTNRGLRVVVRRRDEFEGRCAGTLTLKAGRSVRERARFNFGSVPPGAGGPATRTVGLRLSDAQRGLAKPGRATTVVTRPYTSPVSRTQLDITG
jgi:hypothetical protein